MSAFRFELVSGRTYIVETSADLATWTTLIGATQSDNGTTRTVTDPNATGGKKFYRVRISMP